MKQHVAVIKVLCRLAHRYSWQLVIFLILLKVASSFDRDADLDEDMAVVWESHVWSDGI